MKQQTRILIYILIGIAAVVIGSIGIIGSFDNDIPTGQEHIDLGRVYLTELSYEEAVMEFTEAIEIEPLNPEAYLGLAEAYVGMGDNERAVEVLENGYDKTGDERLLKMLEELLPQPEETAVTTEATTVTSITTEETTTVSTVEMAVVPDLSGFSEEEAIAACEEVGLLYNVSYDYSNDVEKGYVTKQAIPAEVSVAKGVSMSFTVSRGKKPEETTAVTTVTTTSEPMPDYIVIKGVQYPISLTELFLPEDNLTNEDIKDLDKMVNLTSLCILNNQITDVSMLKNLTKLQTLSVFDNPIEDLTPLENLTDLAELTFYQNKIKDISPIKSMTNLTSLYLANNQISDIRPLKNLTGLKTLTLFGNQISEIQPLSNLTGLTKLDLMNNQISDLRPLSNLTGLTELNLMSNQISDLRPLNNLTSLTTLNLFSNQITDITPLKGMKSLVELDLSSNSIDDLSTLKEITTLTKLDYQYNDVDNDDLSVLKSLTNLTALDVFNCTNYENSFNYELEYEVIQELEEALPKCDIRH